MTITVPQQDSYEATLTQALDGSSTAYTIYVSEVPVFTFPAEKEVVMTINPTKGFSRQENVLIESYNTNAKTLTVKSGGRAQDRYNGDSPTALSHAVGSKIILSNPYVMLLQLENGVLVNGGVFQSGVSFLSDTAAATLQVPNMTTAVRDAIVTPANGMFIYNTTDGVAQVYDGGSWLDLETGDPVPNASETVAGLVELSTATEAAAGTSAGATGARLVPPNSLVNETSSATRIIPITGTDGKLSGGFTDFTDTDYYVESTAGAADAGKSVITDSNGVLDSSLLTNGVSKIDFTSVDVSVSATGIVATDVALGYRPKVAWAMIQVDDSTDDWGYIQIVDGEGGYAVGTDPPNMFLAPNNGGQYNMSSNDITGTFTITFIDTGLTVTRNIATASATRPVYYRIVTIKP